MSIRLGGELDTVAVPEFRRVPAEAMSESPQTLSVDLTAVSFLSLSPRGALTRVRDTLQHGGAGLDVLGRARAHRLLVERQIAGTGWRAILDRTREPPRCDPALLIPARGRHVETPTVGIRIVT